MTEPRIFTDEEITAYLDNEMHHDLREKIDHALTKDNELQARLNNLDLDTTIISNAFDGLLDSAPDAPDLKSVKVQGGMDPTLYKVAVAALVALIIGVTAGNKFSQNAQLAGWRGYVAAYHSLYSTETLADINWSEDVTSRKLASASSVIGMEIPLETISAAEDLTFKYPRVLEFKGNPLLQLTFVTIDGTPVALCIIRKPDIPDSGPKTAILEGMPATSWAKNGYDYILIGGSDSKLIENAAAVYASKI